MTGDKASASSFFSPYALTSNDNLGKLIINTQLKGPNFEEWAKAIRVSLCVKKKMRFINGAIKQPVDTSKDIKD